MNSRQRPLAVWRLMSRMQGRSLAEIRERAIQTLRAQWEYHLPVLGRREPSDRDLLTVRAAAVYRVDGDLRRALAVPAEGRSTPRFFSGVGDGSAAMALRSQRWSGARAALLAEAQRVVAGRHAVLGYDEISYGSPIDWHLDPIAGRRASRVHWSRIKYLDADRFGDHKVIWEINRHQHFYVLGRAYQVTGDLVYATTFTDQLSHWIEQNPPSVGINWASSLELAYRAIAWLWAIELFRDAPSLTPALLRRTIGFLHLHGRHIEQHLSTYFSPNTHLTGEALGLFYLGVLLPGLRSADRWRRLGWKILEKELPNQLHDDGVYFEQASYYHRYTVDIYLHAILLARLNDIAVPTAMTTRLDSSLSYLADISRPGGTIPLIGDDDGGRLSHLDERANDDVRGALGLGAIVLGRPELAAVAGGATEESLWILGASETRELDLYGLGPSPSHGSRLYPHGGYAIMRDGWGGDAMHAVIDCGPLARGSGGHAHADALAVVLSVGEDALLVDSGTYTYTTSLSDRNHFRLSGAHNTVTLDGLSSSIPNGPFSWSHRGDALVEHWWTGSLFDRLVGSHKGFEGSERPAVHRRSVVFVRGEYWILVDVIESAGTHEAVAHFHGPPGSIVESAALDGAWLTVQGIARERRIYIAVGGDAKAMEWADDWHSPSYGLRLRAPHGTVCSRGVGRQELITIIAPVEGKERVIVREVPARGGRALRVTRRGVTDLLLTSSGADMSTKGASFTGEMAILRYGARNAIPTAVALFGRNGHLVADGLTFSVAGAAEMVTDVDGWRVLGDGQVRIA